METWKIIGLVWLVALVLAVCSVDFVMTWRSAAVEVIVAEEELKEVVLAAEEEHDNARRKHVSDLMQQCITT
ncbi:unnamed protein product [Prunus armeniaca]|uniref:Uncharacterized protein n=1 Tax=Prunus armeniaca TaxID=36596 RepID=A0A6J5V8T7_PRUAR|nr:hypothetical protein GBA52_019253 [Prunus armeniaca]CAB4284592.1 unnamed protein product [Prunus armeniaca]CAB4315009.1 unnamed protein product [Prunus armeniaca]